MALEGVPLEAHQGSFRVLTVKRGDRAGYLVSVEKVSLQGPGLQQNDWKVVAENRLELI